MTATTPAFTRAGPGWRHRLESVPVERLRGLGIAAVLVTASAVLHAVNLGSAPQRHVDEGNVVARAWAFDNLGSLSPTTYVYDHPPLGWLQVGAWTWLTGAFDRASTAVAAGRETMLVAHLVSGVLLWILARRLGLARWPAAAALALYGLSPLAVHVHRQVLLENLAVPWILAAFVLAASPRQRLGALAASGACLGAAVLTSETALLVVPALALQLWRATVPATRRYVLTVAGSAFLAVCGGFAVVAAARGQLLPGSGHPSLVEGAWHQMFGRTPTGSLLDADSVTRQTVSGWLALDPIGPLLALVAAPLALFVAPRLAPIAVGFLVVAAVLVRPGHLPPGLVVVLLPLGTLLVATVVEHAWNWPPGEEGERPDGNRARPLAPWILGGTALAAAVGVPAWVADHGDLLGRHPDRPMREATRWIVGNVPADQDLIVDDAIWVDLVEAGADPDHVTGYAALDADPDLGGEAARDWREHDFVVTTEALRAFPDAHRQVAAAASSSVAVATFGSGEDQVDVRRIAPTGDDRTGGTRRHDTEEAAAAGSALARNTALELSPSARRALVAGEVDERVMTTLVAVAADRPVAVERFATNVTEAGTDAPHRIVGLRARDAAEAEAVAQLVADQEPPYRPADVDVGSGGRLTVTYPP